MQILVVDDDPVQREIWGHVFEAAGHAVECRETAADGRNALRTGAFDVVVVDLNLGEESGLSVATLAGYEDADCGVILMTSSALFAQGEVFNMNGNIDFILRKPVPASDMLAIVNHIAPEPVRETATPGRR